MIASAPLPEPELALRWPGFAAIARQNHSCSVARSRADVVRIGRARYKCFVEDQGQSYATPIAGCLIDPVDQCSLNLQILQEGELAAAVRLSWVSDVVADDYLAALVSNLPPNVDRTRCTICSRLIVPDASRNALSLLSLFRMCYRLAVRAGANYAVLSAVPHHLALFEAVGWQQLGVVFSDGTVGDQVLLGLDLRGHHPLFDTPAIGDPDSRRVALHAVTQP